MIDLTLMEVRLWRFFFCEELCFKLHVTHGAGAPEVSALAEGTLAKQVFGSVKGDPWGLACVLRYLCSRVAGVSSFRSWKCCQE